MRREDEMNSRIGEWMKSKRIENGYTLQQVADKMDVSRTAVHYWETGKRTIYAINFIEYCHAINVDAASAVHEIGHSSIHEARA